MFADETLDTVGIQSSWRKSLQSAQDSRSCQTLPLHTSEAEVQAVHTTDSSSQTDAKDISAGYCEADTFHPGLQEFLSRIEEKVINELIKNSRSHAFDGFEVNWIDQNENVSCIHRLQHPDAHLRGLQVTSLSWSPTGSVIACAFGRADDGDWNTERSCVCTWNLDRRGLDPKRPDLTIDMPCAVMCLAFHPQRPSLIAGGLYNGEVVVWDTSCAQDPVLAQTGMSADTHREPVYQVHWLPGPRRGELEVLSAGCGGRILQWRLDSVNNRLVLTSGFALVRQQVPMIKTLSKTRGSNTIGVTALALSPWDPDSFLVGSEGGLVLKCSFSSQTVSTAPPDGESVTLRAPAQFCFSPSSGPIHSLHCSPFHRNLFVSGGTDGLAHLHSLLQPEPLLSLRLGDSSYVFALRWSPTRPLVFAAATGQGLVQVFDLGCKPHRVTTVIDQETGGKPVYCLEFNPRQSHLLAAGNADGTVNIWQLSANLTEQVPREMAQLEQLAGDVGD